MKIGFSLILLIVLGFLVFHIFSLGLDKGGLTDRYIEAKAKLEQVKGEQAKLQNELEYLANPRNLEKELRARFNLKKPGEKTIIIVPQENPKP